MRSVARLPEYAAEDAGNLNSWTLFPHDEKRFDSVKVSSGVLVRAYRSGHFSAPGLCRRDRRSRVFVGPWV